MASLFKKKGESINDSPLPKPPLGSYANGSFSLWHRPAQTTLKGSIKVADKEIAVCT